MSNDREHLATLAALLAMNMAKEASPIAVARDAIALIRIGKQANTLATRQCNGEGHWENGRWNWDDSDEARAEKRRATMRKNAQKIADDYGATVELGGDPRGYVLRLHLPSHVRNGFGDGWGVA
jgi:hypothetical protein